MDTFQRSGLRLPSLFTALLLFAAAGIIAMTVAFAVTAIPSRPPTAVPAQSANASAVPATTPVATATSTPAPTVPPTPYGGPGDD